MANFLLLYHGGSMPETPEEGAKVMKAWTDWFEQLGEGLVDGGNPTSKVQDDPRQRFRDRRWREHGFRLQRHLGRQP